MNSKQLFFLFFFTSLSLISQISSTDLKKRHQKHPITEVYADSILSNHVIKDSTYAITAHTLSFFFKKVPKDFKLAIKYGKIEASHYETLGINNKAYNNILYNLGNLYITSDLDTAIHYYKKAVNSNAYPKKVAQALCMLGKVYYQQGDLFKSKNYYEKGLPLLLKYGSTKSFMIHTHFFADLCSRIKDKQSITAALEYRMKVDSLLTKDVRAKLPRTSIYNHYNTFGILYSFPPKYDFEKSKSYYLQNLKSSLAHNDSLLITNTYSNLGELYLNEKKDSAVIFLNKSISFDISNNIATQESYRNLAVFYLSKNKTTAALTAIENSLNIGFNTATTDEITTLSSSQILNTSFKTSLIQSLTTKTKIFIQQYHNTKDQQFLQKAIRNVYLSQKIITLFVQNTTEVYSKLLWRAQISESYQLGIYAAFLLNKTEDIYSFIESNKAYLLTESIIENNTFLQLPYTYRNENLAYQKKIFDLEYQIQKNNTKKNQDQLFNLKRTYETFKTNLKNQFPEYFKYSKKIVPISIQKARKQLKEDEYALYYQLVSITPNKKFLIGLRLSNTTSESFKIDYTDTLAKELAQFQHYTSKPITTQNNFKNFQQLSFNLYNTLFPTEALKTAISEKKIIIIPDLSLQKIPFEALSSSSTSLQYLVEQSIISYAYSLSFINFTQKQKRNHNDQVSVFTPIHFLNTAIPSLTYSAQESSSVLENISGEQFLEENASKTTFLKESSRAKIIHLATHANTGSNPSIQFYDTSLQLHELYTYKNNAELVVLSGCNTNIGVSKKGEGTFNLSRGFFYSGANSVISTLWGVNDSSSAYLINDFYKNLKNNQSKAVALTNAKRNYLKTHQLSEKSPYYWSSFILIGDTHNIHKPLNIKLITLISLTISIFFYFFFKKRG